MKIVKYIYEKSEIEFGLQNEGEIMINATEMAKAFDKRTDVFLKAEHTKRFISALEEYIESESQKDDKSLSKSENKTGERPPYGGRSDVKIIDHRGHMGTYFDRRLALKFAAWLSPKFEVWVYQTLETVMYGHLREYKQAMEAEYLAKIRQKIAEQELRLNPSDKTVKEFFKQKKIINRSRTAKRKALQGQLSLFEEQFKKLEEGL